MLVLLLHTVGVLVVAHFLFRSVIKHGAKFGLNPKSLLLILLAVIGLSKVIQMCNGVPTGEIVMTAMANVTSIFLAFVYIDKPSIFEKFIL